MIYVAKSNKVVHTNDAEEIALHSCLQELRLWWEENPIDIESGIDYFSVFNKSVFLKTEVDRVCQNHSVNFASIDVGELEEDEKDPEKLKLKILFTFKSGHSIVENLWIKANI